MAVTQPDAPDILSPEHHEDPYRTYRILLEERPVCYHAPTNSWLVSRHEDLVALFRDKVFSSENYSWQLEPVHGRTILQMEGREHTIHRRLLNPFFHGAGLERFGPTIEATARGLAEPFLSREAEAVAAGERDRGEVDIVGAFTNKFPIGVIIEMLDLPKADHEKFERWYQSIMDFLSNLSGAQEPIDRGLATRRELAEYLLPVIAERRHSDAEDLLSLFCRAEVDGEQLTDDEIRGFVSLMLTAGGETTDRGMASMLKNLIEHPDQLAAVYEDRSLIVNAFAETLRYSPPVHLIMRQPLQDVEIQGVKIPAGATITCVLAAANRDPRKFSDPDRFDIFRPDNNIDRAYRASADHLAFIDGRHFCVGAMLARSEIELGANLLLDHMQDLRMRDGFVAREEGVFTRAPERLEVTWIPA
ncbi:MAG TPA: cytochrome P450 [Solirubrobacteraceae bacterium]|nr:cytochrome P450 [Solirubrobacteraceae bacterium]